MKFCNKLDTNILLLKELQIWSKSLSNLKKLKRRKKKNNNKKTIIIIWIIIITIKKKKWVPLKKL